MPVIARFYGIRVYMWSPDHRPPHVHVRYSGEKASVTIRNPREVEGHLPPNALRMMRRWIALHETELLANWDRIERGEPPAAVAPLE